MFWPAARDSISCPALLYTCIRLVLLREAGSNTFTWLPVLLPAGLGTNCVLLLTGFFRRCLIADFRSLHALLQAFHAAVAAHDAALPVEHEKGRRCRYMVVGHRFALPFAVFAQVQHIAQPGRCLYIGFRGFIETYGQHPDARMDGRGGIG